MPIQSPNSGDSKSESWTSKSKKNSNSRTKSKNKNISKSKFAPKTWTSIYRILIRLSNGLYPAQIARQIHLSKQKVAYYIKRMEDENLIKREFRTNFVSYKVTEKGKEMMKSCRSPNSSVCVKEQNEKNIRNHSLRLKLKILKDNKDADFHKELEYAAIQKKNWVSRNFILTYPISMTIEKTPGSVIINFHKFYTTQKEFMNDMFQNVWKGALYAYDYFFRKYDIKLDVFEPEIINFHLANERPDLNNSVAGKSHIKVKLGRKSKVIFPAKFDAEAWTDRSHGDVEIETNDMIYEEKLVMMPERVHELHKGFGALTTQLVNVIEDMTEKTRAQLTVMNEMSDSLRILREVRVQQAARTEGYNDFRAWN